MITCMSTVNDQVGIISTALSNVNDNTILSVKYQSGH